MDNNRSEVHSAPKSASVRHIALLVPKLQAAESNYQMVFEIELIGREALLNDGLWYTLPFNRSWEMLMLQILN